MEGEELERDSVDKLFSGNRLTLFFSLDFCLSYIVRSWEVVTVLVVLLAFLGLAGTDQKVTLMWKFRGSDSEIEPA